MSFKGFMKWMGGHSNDDETKHIDPSKRYFKLVEGLEQLDPKDIEAQKELVCKAIPAWADLDKANIKVRNCSGMGGSQTYIMSCKTANPQKVVVHNKNPDMSEETVLSERRQEKVVYELAKVNATCGRLAEGESWYIEPCAGDPIVFANLPVTEIAKCSARFHKADTEWFEPTRQHQMKVHSPLKNIEKGSSMWYLTQNESFSAILSDKAIVKIINQAEPKPLSEGGKRVVTLHGDWHTGNMLTTPDGSVTAIDLEMTYVGWACQDAAYFFQQAHLNRQQCFEYAKAYLEASGLDASEKSQREFVFDVEGARVFCQLVGLTSAENGLREKNIGYGSDFCTEACTLLYEARSDSKKFDLVVDNGLYHAMFKNNSDGFKKAYEKYGEFCPFFSPESDQEALIYEGMFSLKNDITPEGVFSQEKNTPEVFKAIKIPIKCERVKGDAFYMEIVPNIPSLNLHFFDFKQDGTSISVQVVCGVKPEPPYQLFNFQINMKFKQYKDDSWCAKVYLNKYIQNSMNEMKSTLVKSIVDGYIDSFKKKYVQEF